MLPQKFHLHLFIWFWVILSFLLLSFLLIAKAAGLTFNFKAKILEKTGLLVISSDPKGADLYLDGKFKGKTPYKLEYLTPRLYRITLTKEGYHNWEKTEKIEAGKFIKENALLFLKNPVVTEATDDEAEFLRTPPKEVVVDEDIKKLLPSGSGDFSWDKTKSILLYRTGSEIWLYYRDKPEKERNKIVARFTQDLKKVLFYPDSQHIMFVLNNELRIIETSGTNNTKLLDLPSLDFAVSNSGEQVYFKENNKIKKAKIR